MIEQWLTHQRRDGFWQHGSICEDYAAIECPVYLAGGWADGYRSAVLPQARRLVESPRGRDGWLRARFCLLGRVWRGPPGPRRRVRLSHRDELTSFDRVSDGGSAGEDGIGRRE